MLHLILGPDPKMNISAVLEKVLQRAQNKQGNQFVIVPEQFSFEMERTLCQIGGETISRYAEVLSLSRLADRAESVYGGAATPWLDKGGRLLAAAQAVEQVRSRLKLFASVSQKPEFLESLLTTIDEFGSYGITAQLLSDASSGFTGQFAQKLEELSILYESYLSVCAQAKDPVVRLQNLLQILSEENFAQGKIFYICQFDDFTALEREIVEELILQAEDVTVAFPDEDASGAPVFFASHSALRALSAFCKANNVDVTYKKISYDTAVASDLLHLQTHIAQGEMIAYCDAVENLSFCRYETDEQECRKTAERIKQLVSSGARYRDIGIACADFAGCESVLSRVLDAAQIPHFTAGRDAIETLAGAKTVLAALRAICSGLENTAVLDYLKTDMTGLTLQQCDRLENYAILWNVSASRWEQEWTWHPVGLGVEWKPVHISALEELNRCRKVGLSALFALKVALQKSKSVSEMSEAVYTYISDISLPERMQELSDLLFDSGEYERSQQYSQMYDILVDALEQMSLVMPNTARSVEDFCRLFEKLLSRYSISTVPATVDEVLIGEVSSFRGKPIDHLFVLGAGEGEFPAGMTGSGIFTEQERKQLSAKGLAMAPLRVDAVDRELSHIYAAIRSAKKSCAISCTGEPSYLMTKAAAPFGGVVASNADGIVLNMQEQASAELRAGVLPKNEIMSSLDSRRKHDLGLLNAPQIRGLYGSSVRLSASSIDKFTGCRFAFFMRYGLRADEREKAKFDASAFGTFVHAVLEKTAQTVIENGGFSQISDDALREIATKAMAEYAEQQLADLLEQNPRMRYLFDRNCQEAMAVVQDMADELRVSDFVPSEFEFKFADDGQMPPIHIAGEKMTGTVKGFVDRVDLYKDGDSTYVRIVDYKTGRKDFDYTDISVGEGMQMLIYLFAITQNGKKHFGENLKPAGVLYHSARQDVVSDKQRLSPEEVRKKQESFRVRKGLIADNDLVIHAMEHFEETPKYLPFSVKKDGRTGDLANDRQMKLLQKHVMDTLVKLTDEIASGTVHPNPIVRGSEHSACTYCEYSAVCQKDFLHPQTRYLKKITNQQFFEQLEREANKDV